MKLPKLPKSYQLKRGVEYSESLKRFLWRPIEGSLFYAPAKKTIYTYLKWARQPEGVKGFMVMLDGYAKIKELKSGKEFWTRNMEVRECIPLETAK